MLFRKKQEVFEKYWILFSFFRIVFRAELFINGSIDIHKHGIPPEAADLFPRNDKLFAFAEAEHAQIEKHNDGDNTPGMNIDLHVVDVSEPLAVANIDDLLVLQAVDTAAFKIHNASPFRFCFHYMKKKMGLSQKKNCNFVFVVIESKKKGGFYGFFEKYPQI